MKVIKIPFGGGGLGHGDGAKDAPDKIQEQLHDLHANEAGIKPNFEFEEIEVDNFKIEASHNNIYKKILTLKEKSIILGGDHSISYPCFKAFASNNKNAGIIVFDAHPDLMDKVGIDSQEDWLRSLISEGIVDKNKVIVIGVRNSDRIETDFADENRLSIYYMNKIFEYKIENICEAVMEKIRKWENVYLSVDIDAVDPAFAPGTGYKEPGGFTSRELIYFIQRLNKLNNIKMIDIVEVNPSLDVADLTSKLAAKIMTELI
ncbi:arginase family protein [Candidatus Woesearchaeota archaeon]|nr:arginase family protein [Candidatus Woesearchaeota archaeon]